MLISILFLSCNNKTFSSEKELLDYIIEEQNGYIQHKNVNGVNFTLLYKPTDLLVNQEIKGKKEVTKAKIIELRDRYDKYLYFNLSMSTSNKELLSVIPKNKNEFSSMVSQLAFGMKDKVHLFNSTKDTIELVDYVYPRMYGMSHSTSMLFVFPREQKKLNKKELFFTIEDFGINTGEVKFKIKSKIVKKKLNLKL